MDDDFVVAWSSQSQYGDGTGYGVFSRRFSSAGASQAVEFQVNTYTANFQKLPALAFQTNGGFVVVWQSFTQDADQYGVFGRRYDAAGAALAAEFQVNAHTQAYQNQPAIAADSDGDFVVACQSYVQDGSSFGIFARRFDSSGGALGAEFQVNTYTQSAQRRPTVAMSSAGDFVVAWDAFGGHDGDRYGVFARRFDSAGVPSGPEFQVNTYTSAYQRQPSAAADADGDFVVVWQSLNHDGSDVGVFGRSFTSAGVAQASGFIVNSFTPSTQAFPAVDFGSDNEFVVAWHSNTEDTNAFGIFAQRFTIPPFANIDVDGDGVIGPLTDGLLILRYAFGFSGSVLIGGAVGGGCTRCTAPDIESYLTSPGLILDVDGNGAVEPLTDALIILRLLFGFSDPVLTANAIGVGCTRCDHPSISAYLNSIDG